MTVRAVLEYMAGGDTIETLMEYFPHLTREDILACLGYAAEHVDLSAFELAAE